LQGESNRDGRAAIANLAGGEPPRAGQNGDRDGGGEQSKRGIALLARISRGPRPRLPRRLKYHEGLCDDGTGPCVARPLIL